MDLSLKTIDKNMAKLVDIEKVELFLIDKLKEIPMGNGKFKIKAECSLESFIEDLHNAVED